MSKNSDFLRDNAEGLKKLYGEEAYKIMILREQKQNPKILYLFCSGGYERERSNQNED